MTPETTHPALANARKTVTRMKLELRHGLDYERADAFLDKLLRDLDEAENGCPQASAILRRGLKREAERAARAGLTVIEGDRP